MRTSENLSTGENRPMRIALVIGLVAGLIGIAGLFISGASPFFQAYLFSFLFWLGISLGSLAVLMLHFLVGSRWGLTIRRVAEAAAGNIWVMAILFIPLLVGLPYLFPWATGATGAEIIPGTPVMAFKRAYLSVPFFIVRAVIYFAAWMLLAYLINKNSARLAAAPADASVRSRLQGLGAFGLIVYTLTMTFASIDWLMSLEPFWSSTVFGLIIILGQLLTALSFAILVTNALPSLSRGRRWVQSSTPIPYRDLGAFLLTFVMAFAYLAYFQFLILWAGNIPREVVWYIQRSEGGWEIVITLIAVFQFALPFAILLTMRARHNLKILAGLGAMLMGVHLVNLFWHVKPVFSPGVFSVSWLDIVLPIAMGGLWTASFFFMLNRRPLLTREEEVSLGIAEVQERPAGAVLDR